jgi:hypothetical protein
VVSNPELAKAIADFKELRNQHAGGVVSRLLETLIGDIRVLNDTVEKEGLADNQGQIHAYLRLLSYLREVRKAGG